MFDLKLAKMDVPVSVRTLRPIKWLNIIDIAPGSSCHIPDASLELAALAVPKLVTDSAYRFKNSLSSNLKPFSAKFTRISLITFFTTGRPALHGSLWHVSMSNSKDPTVLLKVSNVIFLGKN